MPSSPADRNLLFGILAVQMDFVSRDALIEAMSAWVVDKSRRLDELLVEKGAMKPEYRQLLEPLVAAHIHRHDCDAQRSLAALSSVAPLHDELSRRRDDLLCVARTLEREPSNVGLSAHLLAVGING